MASTSVARRRAPRSESPRRRSEASLHARWSVALCLALGASTPQAFAQNYPSRPVRLIIPFAPGGGADAAARLVAMALGKALQQTFVVESKPGGNTAIAASYVARGPADGYTLLMAGGNTMSLNPLVTDQLPYSPANDFAPIGMVSHLPYVIVASAELGTHDLAETLAVARAKPGTIAYASNGTGGAVHLGTELLAERAHVHMNHVPYTGFSPVLTDLISGRISISMLDQASLGTFAKTGKLVELGVTSLQRSPLYPGIPTVAEQGYPGFQVESWFAVYAPANTPPSVVMVLGEKLRAWLATPEARSTLALIGQEPEASTPDAVRRRIESEQKMYAPLIKATGIKIE